MDTVDVVAFDGSLASFPVFRLLHVRNAHKLVGLRGGVEIFP